MKCLDVKYEVNKTDMNSRWRQIIFNGFRSFTRRRFIVCVSLAARRHGAAHINKSTSIPNNTTRREPDNKDWSSYMADTVETLYDEH